VTTFAAFLRAINVGGTGALPMTALVALCRDCGLDNVRTYIQSGNAVFASNLSEAEIVSRLEAALAELMGGTIAVMVRSRAELAAILARNPFPDGDPARVTVTFLKSPCPQEIVGAFPISGPEVIKAGIREVYIHYPNGIGRSKLKLPPTVIGTARNLNTVMKIVAMTEA
jgi:uncharacterized protein (DUF1697 family)